MAGRKSGNTVCYAYLIGPMASRDAGVLIELPSELDIVIDLNVSLLHSVIKDSFEKQMVQLHLLLSRTWAEIRIFSVVAAANLIIPSVRIFHV